MGFFLLGRARKDGELALISPDVYGSRQEALDALTALSSEPAFLHRDSDVFVADLDSATPVLLVASATPSPVVGPGATPEDADVWEAPAEGETAGDEAAEETPAEEGTGLAGALKRAAGALESEGIVAPDSIGPETATEAEESEAAEAAEPEPEAAAAGGAWPWAAETEPPAIPTPVQELEPAVDEPPAYVPDPFEEPSVDGGGLLHVGADDETVALGRPVVMGAYADEIASAVPVSEPSAETEPVDQPEPEPEPEPEVEPAAEPEVETEPAAEAAPEPQVEAEPEPEAFAEFQAIASPEAENEIPVVEPASLLDDSGLAGILADLEPIDDPAPVPDPPEAGSADALTCDDCVYENTCPNKEGLDPSKCGNFQWKAQ